MPSLSILAIRYLEPEYVNTIKCIEATGLPVVYIDRNPAGIGSLSEAINRGMRQMTTDYVWIITNIEFDVIVPFKLLENIGNASVIHPRFESDHKHLRQGDGIGPIPFCEFTAPLIKRSDFIGLDEECKYWGHDLIYGYESWKQGKAILCDYTTSIKHSYIRNSDLKNPIRKQRRKLRRQNDIRTRNRLKQLYGKKWKDITWHRSERDIGEFCNQVADKIRLIYEGNY